MNYLYYQSKLLRRNKKMLDIKLIRKEPDFFSKKLNNRNTKIDLKTLLDLDKKIEN